MNDAVLVGRLQAVRNLSGDQGFITRLPALGFRLCRFAHAVIRPPQPHPEPAMMSASVGPSTSSSTSAWTPLIFEAVNAADVRMIQRGEHLRFALEAREPLRINREGRRQDFDRDVAIQLRVARAIDFAHPADTEQAVDAEHPDLRSDRAPLEQPERRRPLGGGAVDNAASVPDRSSDSTSARSSASFAHSEASAVERSDSGLVNTAP